MTNLDRLNQLLKDKRFGLPAFRQTVTPSFGNLKWLQTKFVRHELCTDEMKILIGMPTTMLLTDSESAASKIYVEVQGAAIAKKRQKLLDDGHALEHTLQNDVAACVQ